MKKIVLMTVLVLAGLLVTGSGLLSVGDDTVCAAACTTIQSGQLLRSDGAVITTGYDEWGYNYQAHLFNGYYCDAYHNASWCQAYVEDKLKMKWNDAWLSNQDCDGDGLLDRHYGFPSYIGSDAWTTNHMSGTYEGSEGETCKWTYFVKISAKPSADYDCSVVGYEIWGDFCVIQSVYNDPCAGLGGVEWQPVAPGLGGL